MQKNSKKAIITTKSFIKSFLIGHFLNNNHQIPKNLLFFIKTESPESEQKRMINNHKRFLMKFHAFCHASALTQRKIKAHNTMIKGTILLLMFFSLKTMVP